VSALDWRGAIDRQGPCADLNDMEAIGQAAQSACATLAAHGPAGFDFSSLTPSACLAVPLCCVLRACSTYQAHIPSWDAGVCVAIQACELEGIDPRDALLGLL
jgi:hypothetical protein